MVNAAREPRAYELVAIFIPELADDDLTNQIQKISSHITGATGAIKETLIDSPWGRRRLAYSVRHNGQDYRDGYYVVVHFDLEPNRMTEIERELKLDVNVMRYLLVHDDPKAGERNTGRDVDADSATEVASGDESAPASTTGTAVASRPAEADATTRTTAAPPVSSDTQPETDQAAMVPIAPAAEEPTAEQPATQGSASPVEESVAVGEVPAIEEPAVTEELSESRATSANNTDEPASNDESDKANDDAKQED